MVISIGTVSEDKAEEWALWNGRSSFVLVGFSTPSVARYNSSKRLLMMILQIVYGPSHALYRIEGTDIHRRRLNANNKSRTMTGFRSFGQFSGTICK